MINQITEHLTPIASWILFASLKSIALIALVMLLQRLLARWLTPQGRYGLWFAVIACLSIPIGMQVSIKDDSPAVTPDRSQSIKQPESTKHEAPIITIGDASANNSTVRSMQSWLILSWLAGVTGLSSAVLRNTIRYAHIKATATEIDASTHRLFQQCRKTLNVRRRVWLATSPIESPIVVGYRKPTLLLPHGLSNQLSSEQLRLVLLHELAHVKRHDVLVNWLITFTQIAHWFNPFVWYALRAMRADMEQACDAKVLRDLSSNEQIEYGNTLIRLSDIAPQRTLLVQNASVIESHSQLKARINRIAQFKDHKTLHSILGAALLIATTSVAVTQPVSTAENKSASITATQPPAKAEATIGSTSAPVQTIKTTNHDGTTATKPTNQQTPSATPKRNDADSSALETAAIKLNYAKGDKLLTFIQPVIGNGMLSNKGSVAFVEQTSMLVVHDTHDSVAAVRQLVATLDVPVEKILLEAIIAVIDRDVLDRLLFKDTPNEKLSNFGVLSSERSVDAELKAAEEMHKAETISSPRMIVENQQSASIEQGIEIPVANNDGTNSVNRKLVLTLAVTPVVRPDHRVVLNVSMTAREVPTTPEPAHLPPVRRINTQFLLDTGQTVIIDTEAIAKRGKTASEIPKPRDMRLVVFVTPKVIQDALAYSVK